MNAARQPFRLTDPLTGAEVTGTVLHPWPREDSTKYVTVRLTNGWLRIVEPSDLRKEISHAGTKP